MSSCPRVLAIAGTDPTGGAGLQADMKSIAAAGGYGMSVVTSVVSQNTCGVSSVFPLPGEVISGQLEAVVSDVTIDALKIGMLGHGEAFEAVEDFLERLDPCVPVVLDPVMVSTSGHRLLDAQAEGALRRLMGRAHLVTPNAPELAVLAGVEVAQSRKQLLAQARGVADSYGVAVLAKGGHLTQEELGNTLVRPVPAGGGARPGEEFFSSPRVETTNTHGTGCSLSSAVATRWADEGDVVAACAWATQWLHTAIVAGAALQVGHGNGPVDHFAHLRPHQGWVSPTA